MNAIYVKDDVMFFYFYLVVTSLVIAALSFPFLYLAGCWLMSDIRELSCLHALGFSQTRELVQDMHYCILSVEVFSETKFLELPTKVEPEYGPSAGRGIL